MIQTLTELGEFLLPTSCTLCSTRQAKPICQKCLCELSILKIRRCVICANPFHGWVCKSCKRDRPYFDATSCVSGEESRLFVPVKSLRSQSGFNKIPGIVYAWRKLEHGRCAPVDLIIPCPWAPSKISTHGFHPSWELAKRMSKISGIPCTPHLIERDAGMKMGHSPNTKILRTQYLTKTCYLNPKLHTHIQTKLKGLRIAIVADFMNTGATLNVVARILKENGAHWVSNWVILRARQMEKI